MRRLNPVKKVLIAGNRHQEGSLEEVKSLFVLLKEYGISYKVERRFAEYITGYGVEIMPEDIIETPVADADAAVSIGGDGTFLRTARWIGRMEVPVLGVNTGHLGFLASHSPRAMKELVRMLKNGEAIVEDRMALCVDVGGIEAELPELPYALNEVAILKEDTASMINVNIKVEGHYLADYLADGLIISTPTGSTGYSLSAGGPILFPTIDALCITPIAPHTLTFRPFVISGEDEVTARTTSRASQYRVSLDGVSFLMPEGSEVKIRRADFTPKVIRGTSDSFADTLRNKLLWGLR